MEQVIKGSVCQQALLFIGPELCMVVLLRFEDRLHSAPMTRFVDKFLKIDDFGCIHFQHVRGSASRRTRSDRTLVTAVSNHVEQILLRQLPDSLHSQAVYSLCFLIS
jgi:hypothetical protein